MLRNKETVAEMVLKGLRDPEEPVKLAAATLVFNFSIFLPKTEIDTQVQLIRYLLFQVEKNVVLQNSCPQKFPPFFSLKLKILILTSALVHDLNEIYKNLPENIAFTELMALGKLAYCTFSSNVTLIFFR